MNKEDWEGLYAKLFEIRQAFLWEEIQMSRGSKQDKQRSKALAEIQIEKAKRYLWSNTTNPEIWDLLHERYAGFDISEFFTLRYFGRDLDSFLGKVREKIESF